MGFLSVILLRIHTKYLKSSFDYNHLVLSNEAF